MRSQPLALPAPQDLTWFVLLLPADLGYDISDDELQKVLSVLDADGSGLLEFSEVCKWWSDQLGQ